MKLSHREKTMIYVMVLVIICGLGFAIIRPMYKSYSKSLDNYDEANTNLMVAQGEVAVIPNIQDTIEEKEAFYNEHKDEFGGFKDADYIEQQLTSYITKHNLTPNAVSVTMPSNDEMNPTLTSDQTANSDDSNLQMVDTNGDGVVDSMNIVDEEASTEDSSDTNSNQSNTVDKVTSIADISYVSAVASYEIVGTYKDFIDLVDECSNMNNVRISSYSIYAGDTFVSYNFDNQTQYVFYVDFNYYMTNMAQ